MYTVWALSTWFDFPVSLRHIILNHKEEAWEKGIKARVALPLSDVDFKSDQSVFVYESSCWLEFAKINRGKDFTWVCSTCLQLTIHFTTYGTCYCRPNSVHSLEFSRTNTKNCFICYNKKAWNINKKVTLPIKIQETQDTFGKIQKYRIV